MVDPIVTRKEGFFGGAYPAIPATVVILDFSLPPGHHVIGGVLYRETRDPVELAKIIYPDGSRPTAVALIPV